MKKTGISIEGRDIDFDLKQITDEICRLEKLLPKKIFESEE